MKHTEKTTQEIVEQIFQQVEDEATQKQEALQKIQKTSKRFISLALFFFAISGIITISAAIPLIFSKITHETVALEQLSFTGKGMLVGIAFFIIGSLTLDLSSFIERRNECKLLLG